jgi:hypothetical protein
MIILTNSIAQTLAPGQSATFDSAILKCGCAECWRNNSGAVRLGRDNSIYEVNFNGNIGSEAAGVAQLAISLDNSPLLETTMISQTAAADELNNVGCHTAVRTCCCGGSEAITVVNTGTTTITLGSNPCLFIKRIA